MPATISATTSVIEPVMPQLSDALRAKSERVAIEAAGLQLPVPTADAFRDLLKQMNCYYSNLIEGVHTHPIDIKRALNGDYALEPNKRRLQELALGHAEAEQRMDALVAQGASPFSVTAALAAHEVLYRMAGEEARTLTTLGGNHFVMAAGQFRERDVEVGRHIGPPPELVPRLVERLDQVYSRHLSQSDRLIAVAAHHHRFAWTHPFSDGNGRTVRLISQAALQWVGVASPLWSVARGLARQKDRYYSLLANADSPRRGDLDGRGNLSHQALVTFCDFYLDVCLDQITFMKQMLGFQPNAQTGGLRGRISAALRYQSEVRRDPHLKPDAATPIFHAFLAGEITATDFETMSGLSVRTAQRALKSVVEHGFLVKGKKRGREQFYSFAIPLDSLSLMFPGLHDAAGV